MHVCSVHWRAVAGYQNGEPGSRAAPIATGKCEGSKGGRSARGGKSEPGRGDPNKPRVALQSEADPYRVVYILKIKMVK